MVKNRRKNGDFYWVLADVTPVKENGQPTAYMSVRTKPAQAQVNAAAEVYRQFRSDNAQGLATRQGVVVGTGLLARMAALRNMAMEQRLALIMGSVSLLLLLSGLLPWLAATFPCSASQAAATTWASFFARCASSRSTCRR